MDPRRVYYDHEPAYRKRRARGYTGWNPPCEENGSLLAFHHFMRWATFLEPGTAMDLGCGGGELCIMLAQAGWTVVGVDLSETAISMAHANAAKAGVDVNLVVADVAQPLPIQPGMFSLVLDNHVRHCLIGKEHRIGFMRNASTALRDGGWMFSSNLSAEGYLDYEGHRIDPSMRFDAERCRYWATLSEMLEEFDQVGLTVQRIELRQEPLKDSLGATATIYASKGMPPSLQAFWGMKRVLMHQARP
jgi:2-polyprenyl-3-methyl-5-hydroxy-6-metoxy-1,4-benzoquinol methylase